MLEKNTHQNYCRMKKEFVQFTKDLFNCKFNEVEPLINKAIIELGREDVLYFIKYEILTDGFPAKHFSGLRKQLEDIVLELEKNRPSKKVDQLTARQISLVFHFLKKAGHFRYPGETTKLKLFLSKISGIGVDAYKKWIPDPIKQSKEFKQKETASLANDLKFVAAFLDETGYPDVASKCRDESEKTQKSNDID